MSLLPQDTRDSLVARLDNPDDGAAWDEVMAVYGPLVYRVALKQGLQKADAEDVVQEVFLTVLKSVADWLEQPKRGRFRSWLAGICRNTSLNVLNRKPKGGVGFGGSDALDALQNVEAPINDITSTFELEYQREVYRWATKQVQSLVSPSTWDAFCQTHIAGRPMDEVAQELGLKVGNVYLARCRVMSRLRELVKQYQEFEHDQA